MGDLVLTVEMKGKSAGGGGLSLESHRRQTSGQMWWAGKMPLIQLKLHENAKRD